jgi:hypothetical protein
VNELLRYILIPTANRDGTDSDWEEVQRSGFIMNQESES